MSDYNDATRTLQPSRMRRGSLEDKKQVGDIDYNYEFLGLNTIKDYDFNRGGGEVASSQESKESIV